jgi:hypothetical protein
MALDFKTLQAITASQPPGADVCCPECGRPWSEPPPERPRPSSSFPWRAVLLGIVGLYLAITLGPRAVRDYPRALRDRAIVEATAECLARTGGQSFCAPSNVAPDGSTDLSLLVDRSAATRRELEVDLAATTTGVVFGLAGLGAPARRRLRARPHRRSLSVMVALWGLGEAVLALVCFQVMALYLEVVALRLFEGAPLPREPLDRAADAALALMATALGS